MEISQNRTLYIVEGILLLLLGIAAIIVPGIFTLSLELLLGWLLIIGGGVQLYRSWNQRHHRGYVWTVISALVNIILGILLIAYPLIGIFSLTLVLIAYFIVSGLYQIVWGFEVKPLPSWWLFILNGILGLALGAILIIGLPGSAIWAIGLLFGINMIFSGAALLALSSQVGDHKDLSNDKKDQQIK